MRPVMERISERVRHGGGPGLELLERAGIAGAKPLGHAVVAHGAPFVVIAFQPDFKQVFELPVGCDVARGKVAVIIEDRFGFGVLVVKLARRFRAQQKIFVDEGHKLFVEQQRLQVPLVEVCGDIFGDDGLVLLEGVEIAVALFVAI